MSATGQPAFAMTCRHGRSVLPLSGARVRQLQEVVSQTHEAPLLRHRGESAPPHLPKPSTLFDLPEDGLHRLFAQTGSTPIAASSELDLHGPGASPTLCMTGGRGLSVVVPTGGHVALDMPPLQFPEVGCRAVARIGRYFSRLSAGVRLDLRDQGRELLLVVGRIAHLLGDDNLTGRIDGGLRVVPLHEAIGGLHDPALGIRNVALGAVGGDVGRGRRTGTCGVGHA